MTDRPGRWKAIAPTPTPTNWEEKEAIVHVNGDFMVYHNLGHGCRWFVKTWANLAPNLGSDDDYNL